MNYETSSTAYREMDLKDVAWNLIAQWKLILITALVIGVIVAGLRYSRDKENYRKALIEQQPVQESELSGDEIYGEMINSLKEEDRFAVQYLLQLQKLIMNQQDYLTNSIWLSDPANQRILTLSYYVKGEEGIDLQALCDTYSMNLRKESFLHGLSNIIGSRKQIKYVSELVSSGNGSIADSDVRGTIFTITVVVPEDTNGAEIEKFVTDALAADTERLRKTIGDHTFKLIDSADYRKYQYSGVERKVYLSNSLNNFQNFFRSTYGTLNSEQKAVMDEILKSLVNDENADAKELDVLKSFEKEIEPPHFRKGYLALGFAFGIFLYVCVYILIALQSDDLLSERNAEAFLGSRILGNVQYQKHYSGLALLKHSGIVDKIRYRSKTALEQQIEVVAKRIMTVCKHSDVSNIVIFNIAVDKEEQKISEQLSETMRAKGIAASLFQINKESDESIMLDAENVISIVGKHNKTADIAQMTKLYKAYDVPQLGCVFVGEY